MRSQSSDHHEKQIVKQLKKSNYYEILDLKSDASQAQIKRSFKKMALKYHPDKNQASCSKEVFHNISQAYDTLSDPSKKVIYDEKQNKTNKNKMQFTFSRSNSYSQNPFKAYEFYDSAFKRAYQFQARFAHRQTQFKMNQKARKQREFFKKQSEQRQKERKKEWNQFFKAQGDFKSSNQSKSASTSTSEKKEKPSWQNTFNNFTKQTDFFTFQRATSKKGSSFSQDYEEVRRQMQRKQRLRRQKQRADKNIRTFMIFVLIVVAWLIFSNFGHVMKGIPVYSMQPSQDYKIMKFTKELKSPFYVTQQYVQRASADDRFRQYLDRKIDIVYIKTLSRVCNTMMKKEQQLYENLDIVKSKKSRKQLNDQLKNLDLSACNKLYDARQLNPVYFKELFADPKNREQL